MSFCHQTAAGLVIAAWLSGGPQTSNFNPPVVVELEQAEFTILLDGGNGKVERIPGSMWEYSRDKIAVDVDADSRLFPRFNETVLEGLAMQRLKSLKEMKLPMVLAGAPAVPLPGDPTYPRLTLEPQQLDLTVWVETIEGARHSLTGKVRFLPDSVESMVHSPNFNQGALRVLELAVSSEFEAWRHLDITPDYTLKT